LHSNITSTKQSAVNVNEGGEAERQVTDRRDRELMPQHVANPMARLSEVRAE